LGRRGRVESFSSLANIKVAFEGGLEILWHHDSSGLFTFKSYCKGMYKGMTQLDFLVTQPGSLKLTPKQAFELGQPLEERLQWRRSLNGEILSWLVGVRCVLWRNTWQTTFWSTVSGSPL